MVNIRSAIRSNQPLQAFFHVKPDPGPKSRVMTRQTRKKTRKEEKFRKPLSRENGENQARGDAVTECAVRRET